MKSYKLPPLDIDHTIIGKATRKRHFVSIDKYILLSNEVIKHSTLGYQIVLSSESQHEFQDTRNIIYNISNEFLNSINENDILEINPDGTITVIWSVNSIHNVIMITNQCNCRCVMCPQPSCNDPKDIHVNNLKILRLSRNKLVKNIGLTGGEPTLYINRCIQIIKECKKCFPNATVSLLSNGRLLSENNIAKLVSTNNANLIFCIPLHADVSTIHDLITGCKNSFSETVRGIQNLALFRQKIELRIVINKYNYKRLISISEFIFRNFPFSIHIAFMGMEICGIACKNIEQIWIDPYDYINELTEAVRYLHQRNLRVSIYNIPYCLVSSNYWRFMADSISDWKKGFVQICYSCSKKEQCPGLFLTSNKQSQHIKAL
jgi:His-Xaa-Ser system radical SAM maturase HxsC